jgi:hypothetical protein
MTTNTPIAQEWTPDGVVAVEPEAPKVSWKRGGVNGYDFKFEYEGATIYAKYPSDFAELEAEQDAIVQEAQAIDDALTGIFESRKKNPKKNFDSETDAQNERAEALAIRSARFAHDVVQKCVVNWTGAPEPYSEANKAELPLRMLQDWFVPLIENSRLSTIEQRFLVAS